MSKPTHLMRFLTDCIVAYDSPRRRHWRKRVWHKKGEVISVEIPQPPQERPETITYRWWRTGKTYWSAMGLERRWIEVQQVGTLKWKSYK